MIYFVSFVILTGAAGRSALFPGEVLTDETLEACQILAVVGPGPGIRQLKIVPDGLGFNKIGKRGYKQLTDRKWIVWCLANDRGEQ